jgi:hypothetical protein
MPAPPSVLESNPDYDAAPGEGLRGRCENFTYVLTGLGDQSSSSQSGMTTTVESGEKCNGGTDPGVLPIPFLTPQPDPAQ